MLEKIRIIFTIPELRTKIFLTLFLLAIYRIGYQIPLPVIDQEAISEFSRSMSGTMSQFLAKVSVFSGSQLNMATIFGLGIMPYISASIILQLMGTVYKPLEELKKEGEAGRKKINQYTRYLTVVLCLVQSTGYLWFVVMASDGSGNNLTSGDFENSAGSLTWFWQLTAVLIMTTGSIFMMWLGEQIDEYGIGNGISLLIMAGIVAQMPAALLSVGTNAEMTLKGLDPGAFGLEKIILLVIVFVAVVVGVVFITLGQRRIPTQSAKHVRGRRVYGGTRQYMPLKINQAGVMPIIFAQSLMMIPPVFLQWLFKGSEGAIGNFFASLGSVLQSPVSMVYNLVYIGLIYFFCYFWTAITFNPKEISDNMKENGTFIPGYRPGRRTEDYLHNVLERITYVGAGFLALIAVVPTMITTLLGVDFLVASFYGGTGLLIAVSVGFDLVQKIDSHLVMRNYSGLLE